MTEKQYDLDFYLMLAPSMKSCPLLSTALKMPPASTRRHYPQHGADMSEGANEVSVVDNVE